MVPFSAESMFDLGADVETYPEFLPWCTGAKMLSRDDAEIVATLTIGYGSLNTEFTTRNNFAKPDWMTLQLDEGPFSSLEGRWDFHPLGQDGCEVILGIEFEFSNAFKDVLFGATFESICSELIDAFVKRAHALYD